MFLLQAHYASPVDYTEEALERAQAACATLRNRLRSGSGHDPAVMAAGAARRSTTTSRRRGRSRCCSAAPPEARDTVAEVLDVLGLGALAQDEPAPAEVVALAEGPG